MKALYLFITSVLLAHLSFSQSSTDSTLMVYLPFDNKSITDFSSNHYPTQAANISFTTDHNGIANNAAAFNGSTSSFQVNSFSTNVFESDFSISCWVWFNNFTQLYPVIAITDQSGIAMHGTGPYYGLNQYKVTFYGTTPNLVQFSNSYTNTILPTNQWLAYTIVRKVDTLYHFLNSNPVGKIYFPRNPIYPSSYLDIGCYSGSTTVMDGNIDEFRLYSRAITNTEIKQLSGLGNVTGTIEFTNEEPEILAYPTVVLDGKLYINNKTGNPINLVVFNQIGSRVLERYNPSEIDIDALPKGLYRIVSINGEGSLLNKNSFIIE